MCVRTLANKPAPDKPAKQRGRPKIDGNAVLKSGKPLADMTPTEVGAVVKILFEYWHAAQGAPSTPVAPGVTSRREALRIERERKQATLDPFFDRGFRIAEAAAAANVSYADAQRARMLWQGKQALEDRQRATMSPSAKRAADAAGRGFPNSADNTAPVPASKREFTQDEIHDFVRNLDATRAGAVFVMPDDVPDDLPED